MSNLPNIKWSVWDKSPTVKWEWFEHAVTLEFKHPPLSVCALEKHGYIAVAVDPEEAKENLKLYLPSGELFRSYSAPDLGDSCHFSAATELQNSAQVEAVLGCFSGGKWNDKEGILTLETGLLVDVQRSY